MNSIGVYPDPADFILKITTPRGDVFEVDDPRVINELAGGTASPFGAITLHRSDRAMTDCRPVSLISVQTARRLGEEINAEVDKRRFRANLYLDLMPPEGFAEIAFVGRRLRIGSMAEILVTDRDPRCKMITLDPDTAQQNPEVLRAVNRSHDNKAGVYGAVLIEGMVQPGDQVVIAD